MDKYSKNMYEGVLFINLGTPRSPTYFGVMSFLRQFLSDKNVIELPRLLWLPILYGFILPFRSYSSAKNYLKIWKNGSPLMINSEDFVNKVKQNLDPNLYQVELAMRYGEPSIDVALERLRSPKLKKLHVVPLFPQYSNTTTGSCIKYVFSCLHKWKFIPQLNIVNHFCDEEFFLNSYHKMILENKSFDRKLPTIFSYHGLPANSLNKGDPYYCFCIKTTRLLIDKLKLDHENVFTCFQSRFGFNEWLKPYLSEQVVKMAKDGHKVIQIITPSFVSDCIETIDEIGNELLEEFQSAGGKKINLFPCLNDNDVWGIMMSEFIKNK